MGAEEESAVECSYPHVAAGLCKFWGSEKCQDYLEGLLFDRRGGRQGFPPDVSTELLFLYNLLDRRPGKYDIWREADSHT